jgi:hypothetical protein
VKGLLKLYDTGGLPLAEVLSGCVESSLQPCWMSFVGECLEQGWSKKTIESRLQESIVDVYGKDYWNEVNKKLKEWKLL